VREAATSFAPAPIRFWGLALAAALALVAACGEERPPAPRDKASLAPFVASPEVVVEEMLRLADVGKDDLVYDLGSGDGRIVIMAAKIHGARGVGIELDADLVHRSTENARRAGVAHLVQFRQQDVMTVDLSPATVVTIYLSQKANLQLRPRLRAQLQPGARVVSHGFDMGDWQPDAYREFRHEAEMTCTLYLWRIPGPLPKP
jgi:SAM-dependent methyltransferase